MYTPSTTFSVGSFDQNETFSEVFWLSKPAKPKHKDMWDTNKNPPTFRYTGWLIGILIVFHYNPYKIWVV